MRRVATAVLVLLVTGVGERRHGDGGPGRPAHRRRVALKLAGRDFKPHESVRVRVVSRTRTSTRRAAPAAAR